MCILPIDKIREVWYNVGAFSGARPRNFYYIIFCPFCQVIFCTNFRFSFFPKLCILTNPALLDKLCVPIGATYANFSVHLATCRPRPHTPEILCISIYLTFLSFYDIIVKKNHFFWDRLTARQIYLVLVLNLPRENFFEYFLISSLFFSVDGVRTNLQKT